MIARQVNFLSYILEISDDPGDYIEKNLKRIKTYKKKIGITFHQD